MALLLMLALLFPPQDRPPEKCSLSGTVVSSVTGESLNKVGLALEPVDRQATHTAVTTSDAQGRFALMDLELGRYHLRAGRNGYLGMSYGARRPDGDGAIMRLDAGQSLNDLKFKLTPAGVITGTVRDSDGEPLENAHVALARFAYKFGRPRLDGQDSMETDDRGEYRFRGLTPGRYYIGVEAGSSGWDNVDHSASVGPTDASVPTLYPGVPDAALAAPIEVAPGARVTGIDVTLLRSRVVCVSGRVINAPAANRLVVILTDEKSARIRDFPLRSPTRNADGDFQICHVPPGSYVLSAGTESSWARLPVDVGAANVEGLSVTLATGAEIKGRVIAEGPIKPKLAGLDFFLTADGRPGYGNWVAEDGAITLRMLPPGRYDVRSGSLLKGFYVKSIRAGETDALTDGFVVSGPGTIPLEIVLASDAGGVVPQSKSRICTR